MAVDTDAILDSETRGHDDHHEALRLWLRMLTCGKLIENQLRCNLREACNSTLPRFDLLAQLERHPHGLTMGDLSKLMMVSGGNVTGIAAQLEKEGLIKRIVALADRRSFQVHITPKGSAAFYKMAQVHETSIASMFSCLNGAEMDQVMETLSTLKQSLRAAQAR